MFAIIVNLICYRKQHEASKDEYLYRDDFGKKTLDLFNIQSDKTWFSPLL